MIKKSSPLPRIIQAGDPILRLPAELVEPDQIKTPEIQNLISTMTQVMRQAPGVGLAAPQIGISLQILVLEDNDHLMARLSQDERKKRERGPIPLTVLINPKLKVIYENPSSAKKATFFEGCLSVRGYVAQVERDLEVEVEGLNENAETVQWRVRGWPARILQHEIDHLGGTLFIDRMISRSFTFVEEQLIRR